MKPTFESAADDKYSQLTPLAVVALLLGMASALALIGPLFFLAPAAAIGVALIALGKIRESDGALSGAGLARVGMALAVIFVVASLVRNEVRDRLLKQQAGAAAVHWIELMTDGEVDESLRMLSGEGARSLVPQPQPGAEPRPAEESERMAHERLQQDPLVRDFAAVDEPTIGVESVSEPEFDGGRTVMAATLFLADPASGEHRHVQVNLSRNKFYEAEGMPWRVDHWDAGAAHGAH